MMRRLLLIGALSYAPAMIADPSGARGGRVSWGRLVTESNAWIVHEANDPALADFIRQQTSLNLDSAVHPANSASLEALCEYPFIFTNNLTDVRSAARLDNIREYLRRGGFIYIDRCVNLSFSLEQEEFYRRHIALFQRLLPGSEVRLLTDDDAIFRCYFDELSNPVPIPGTHSGIYGVFDGGRMVMLLSLANYQCGWPNTPTRRNRGMRMIANIYVYAMTRGTGDNAVSK